MKTLGNIVGAAAALALTAGICFLAYSGVRRFGELYAQLDFQVAMITATACGTLLVAAFMIVAGIRSGAARTQRAEMYAAKAEVCRTFIGFWEETLRPGRTGEVSQRLSKQLQELNHLLAVYGYTPLLKIHLALQSMNVADARAQLGNALLAIRKDLDLESSGLKSTEISQLLFSDPDITPATPTPELRPPSQPQVSLASNT